MAMVCPQCSGSFEQRLQCPTCGVRLVYHQAAQGGGGTADSSSRWQQTPWGRILIGVLLAQGLYHGLRHLFTAGLMAAGDDTPGDAWATLYGLLFLQGLQALGLLVGGALAGAGKRQGLVYGAIIGVWNGVICVVMQGDTANPAAAIALYGQPILQTAFGALGGFIGGLIWRPPPSLAGPSRARPVPIPSTRQMFSAFSGRIAWGRVLAGAAVAAGGTAWASVILDMVLAASEGKLNITSHVQAQLVTWEITTLAILVGSGLAGATTTNGLKQGLLVGLIASAVLLGVRLGSGVYSVDHLVYTGATTLAMSLLGGWFGGQLFPSLMPPRKRISTTPLGGTWE